MTDRHSGYLVTLDRDIREDDAEWIITALRMVKGVAGVTPVPADPLQHISEMRVSQKWRDALYALAKDGPS